MTKLIVNYFSNFYVNQISKRILNEDLFHLKFLQIIELFYFEYRRYPYELIPFIKKFQTKINFNIAFEILSRKARQENMETCFTYYVNHKFLLKNVS